MISVFIVTSISATMFAAAAENSNNPHTDINCPNIVQESLSSQPEDNTDFSLYNSFYISTMDDLKTQVTAAADGIPVELIIDNTILFTEQIVIPKNADITLKGSGTLERSPDLNSSSGGPIVVQKGAKLTIDGITLDGKQIETHYDNNSHDGYWIKTEGTLILNSGTVTGNHNIGAFGGVIAVVGSQAHFEMNGGSIENNKSTVPGRSQYSAPVTAVGGASFTMNGGFIQNNDYSDTMNTGAVYINPQDGNSSFEMNGGYIRNNQAHSGAVFVGDIQPDYTHIASFIMNNGTISDNTVSAGSGGIFILANGKAVMNDGLISGNTGNCGGGVGTNDRYAEQNIGAAGIRIEDWSTTYKVPAAFTMNGGTISGNKAMDCGGGVYVASNTVVLNAGQILNNTALDQGGGIYVGTIPYVLHMYNAVIAENTASVLGGGIWSCPTGDVTIHVNNGGAVFDNTALQNAAGDDFVSVPRSENYITTLSERMLGGGKADYYTDGKVLENSGVLGQPDPSVPRFEPANPGSPITDIINSTDSYALKVITNDAAKQLANEKASLFITGNHSERGGGIGTNGSVVIGTEDNWKLNVTKIWNQVPESNYQDKEISIRLKIGDYELDTITLNQENNWTGSFTHLPSPDTLQGKVITVIEEGSEYNVSYSEIVRDDDTKTLYLTVTNELKTGNLTVSKTVLGEHADLEQNFEFTVTLSDTSVNGMYGDIEFINGTATFVLKHGESKTAYGLPAGIQYQVTEQAVEGYTLNAVGDTGTVPADGTAVAEFTNTKDNDIITDTPDSPEEGQMDSPKTGDSSNILFLLLPLAILSVAIAAILFINKQAHKN
mgnify:FL=1